MLAEDCHGAFIFGLSLRFSRPLLGCPWPSPWGDRAQKSDMLGDASGVQLQACCRRVRIGPRVENCKSAAQLPAKKMDW